MRVAVRGVNHLFGNYRTTVRFKAIPAALASDIAHPRRVIEPYTAFDGQPSQGVHPFTGIDEPAVGFETAAEIALRPHTCLGFIAVQPLKAIDAERLEELDFALNARDVGRRRRDLQKAAALVIAIEAMFAQRLLESRDRTHHV